MRPLVRIWAVLCLLLVPFLAGCHRRSGLIDMTSAPLLQVDAEWALVVDPYALYRSEPSLSAPTAGYGRRGDLQEVQGRRIVTENKEQTLWLQFDLGWLPETSVQLYTNQLKAASAARELEAIRDESR